MRDKDILPKQRQFVELLMLGKSATAAYSATYPRCSEGAAKTLGYRLMRKPKVAAVIAELRAELAEKVKGETVVTLKEALESSLSDLDGFFTFVVGTETGFAVVRDPIACKPAVMAETDDYVAFGSEYRALVGLPGIASARVFEPEPAKVYAWERH